MKKEIVLLFNGKIWGAYSEGMCPDIGIDPNLEVFAQNIFTGSIQLIKKLIWEN